MATFGGADMEHVNNSAALCHEQADRIRSLALTEGDQTKRRLLFAVAEQYYLLHDQLVELQRYAMRPGSKVDLAATN